MSKPEPSKYPCPCLNCEQGEVWCKIPVKQGDTSQLMGLHYALKSGLTTRDIRFSLCASYAEWCEAEWRQQAKLKAKAISKR